MGNTCSSVCCRPSTNGASSSQCPKASSLEDLRSRIDQIGNPNARINELLRFVETKMTAIQQRAQPSGTSEEAQTVSTCIEVASDFVDHVSIEVEISKGHDLAKALGSATLDVAKHLGEVHWILLGLSVVSYAIEAWQIPKSNAQQCIELLQEMVDVAKNIRRMYDRICRDSPQHSETLERFIRLIVEGVFVILCYCEQNKFVRLLLGRNMQEQLQTIREKMHNMNSSLNRLYADRTLSYIHRNIPNKPRNRWPKKPYDFQPVGITERVKRVKSMLDINGADVVKAVVIHGFGGLGKTYLAKSVIYEIASECPQYVFCETFINEKGDDLDTQCITSLQQDIIQSLEGQAKKIGRVSEGRQEIANAMKGKQCLFFIDNVFCRNSVKELLPQNLSLWRSQLDASDSATRVRILITSREARFKSVFDVAVEEFGVERLDEDSAKEILGSKILRGGGSLIDEFDEMEYIEHVAAECKGVPLILSTFGDHLRDRREEQGKSAYQNALWALQEGNIDSFTDENLSKPLMFVFDNLRDPEWKEAFLDICTYFHDWKWINVGRILEERILHILHEKSLLTKSQRGTVLVHDILRLMASKKSAESRVRNTLEFLNLKDNKSAMEGLRGLRLVDGDNFAKLEASALEMMSGSLRILILSNTVCIDEPCKKKFKQLRYMELGDLHRLPFRDLSQIKSLRYYINRSLPGMDMFQLPQCTSLQHLEHDLTRIDVDKGQDYINSWKQLHEIPLQVFIARSWTSLRLPPDIRFYSGLSHLELVGFNQIPKLSGLVNLKSLWLDSSDFETLPASVERMTSLTSLSLLECRKLVELPEGLGKLKDLIKLDIRFCENLRRLPESICNLSSLTALEFAGCINLETLPETSYAFHNVKVFSFAKLYRLTSVPSSLGNLAGLEELCFDDCEALSTLPAEIVKLESLKVLLMGCCSSVEYLPNNFSQLKSLERLDLNGCRNLRELPTAFEALTALKTLTLRGCKGILKFPETFERLVCLEAVDFSFTRVSQLPRIDGLKRLHDLNVHHCSDLETLWERPDNCYVQNVKASKCSKLPARVMDSLLELPRCIWIDISKSTQLMERWKQLKMHTDCPSLIVSESPSEEWQEAARRALLKGPSKSWNGVSITSHACLPLGDHTVLLLICIPSKMMQLDPQQMAVRIQHFREKALAEEDMMLVFFRGVKKEEELGEDDNMEEKDALLQALPLLPHGSHAITGDSKRFLSLKSLFFRDFIRREEIDFMTDEAVPSKEMACRVCVNTDEHGIPWFSKRRRVHLKNERTGRPAEAMKADKGLLLSIAEAKKDADVYKSKCGSDIKVVLQILKQSGLDWLINRDGQKREIEALLTFGEPLWLFESSWTREGAVALLEYLSETLSTNIVWVARKDGSWFPTYSPGYGTYMRRFRHMPARCWALEHPLFSSEYVCQPKLLCFDGDGMLNADKDMLKEALLMRRNIWPCDRKAMVMRCKELQSRPPLEILMGDFFNTHKKLSENLVVLLYGAPASLKDYTRKRLQHFINRVKAAYMILYIGPFLIRSPAEYKKATEEIPGESLPFKEMVLFQRRRLLVAEAKDEEGHSSLGKDVKSLAEAMKREMMGIIMAEGGNVITERGEEVVEMMLNEKEEENEQMQMMREEVEESLQRGKCCEMARQFLLSVLSPYTRYPRFPCRACGDLPGFYDCFEVGIAVERYQCRGCARDLCGECFRSRESQP